MTCGRLFPHHKAIAARSDHIENPKVDDAELSALVELAKSRYYAWHRKELRPERDRRRRAIDSDLELSRRGRITYRLRLCRELVEKAARKRIELYAEVAYQSKSCALLFSPSPIEEFRHAISISVGSAVASEKDHIRRQLAQVGQVSLMPQEGRFTEIISEVMTIVRTELAPLKAEGALLQVVTAKPDALSVDDEHIAATLDRAQKRNTFVMPILQRKGWSRNELADEAGVGKNSIYAYLNGTRGNITAPNRKAIADALGVDPSALPE